MTKQFTPGFVWESGMVVTPSRLNRMVEEAQREDGTLTTAMIADGALSADAAGRVKMADRFVTSAKLAEALENKIDAAAENQYHFLDEPFEVLLNSASAGGWAEIDLASQISAAGLTTARAAVLQCLARVNVGSGSGTVGLFVQDSNTGTPDVIETRFLGVRSTTSSPATIFGEGMVICPLAAGKFWHFRVATGTALSGTAFRIGLAGFVGV